MDAWQLAISNVANFEPAAVVYANAGCKAMVAIGEANTRIVEAAIRSLKKAKTIYIAEHAGMSDVTTYRHLKRLVDRKKVKQVGREWEWIDEDDKS